MAKRDRLEDLGRILVISEQIMEHGIFQHSEVWSFPKRSGQKFQEMTPELQEILINDTAYALEEIYEKISLIAQIASANDDLNNEIIDGN